MLDSGGALLWTNTFDHGQAERLVDIEVNSSTEEIYVLVNTEALDAVNLGMDYIILKYTAAGDLIDTLVYDHDDSPYSNENDEASDMVLDDSGDIYVLSRHFHGSCTTADTKILIEKFSPSFASSWSYSSPSSYVSPYTICFSSTGKLYIAYKYNWNPIIASFNATTGALINETTYVVPGTDGSESFKLCPDNAGNIYGLADYYVDGTFGGFYTPRIIKVDDSGDILWSDTLKHSTDLYYSHPNDLEVDASGDLYVSYTTDGSGESFATLAKISGSDTKLWRIIYGGAALHATGHDLDRTAYDEILFASSHETAGGDFNALLRKYSTSGDLLWESDPYNLESVTKPTGRISVSDDGDLYVSGDSGSEVFTIRYAGAALGVQKSLLTPAVSVFPNPCESALNFAITAAHEGATTVTVRNMLGEVVWKNTVDSDQLQSVNVSDLPSGAYVLLISNDKGIVAKQTFVRK